jgi:hypothetical protein
MFRPVEGGNDLRSPMLYVNRLFWRARAKERVIGRGADQQTRMLKMDRQITETD